MFPGHNLGLTEPESQARVSGMCHSKQISPVDFIPPEDGDHCYIKLWNQIWVPSLVLRMRTALEDVPHLSNVPAEG